MLTRLIHLSLNNRVLIVLVSVALMAVGLYVSTTMPVDVFPDFTAPTVTILTEAHGMAPSEVETLVTFPIETSMNGTPGVRRAVVDEGGEVVVYLQRGGETFERRRVEVGIRDANQVEIRNGLAVGDRVATKGAYTIRLSTLSSAIPAHGHAH